MRHENERVAGCQVQGRIEQDAIETRANFALVGTVGAERKRRIAVEPIDWQSASVELDIAGVSEMPLLVGQVVSSDNDNIVTTCCSPISDGHCQMLTANGSSLC